jgi:hypothetical protein
MGGPAQLQYMIIKALKARKGGESNQAGRNMEAGRAQQLRKRHGQVRDALARYKGGAL